MQIQNDYCHASLPASTKWQMETDARHTLFPYQLVGAAFLAESSPRFLLDEMGVGKSAQAVAGADVADAKRILVLTPAIAVLNTVREFQRWQRKARTLLAVLKPGHLAQISDFDVVVMSYDMAARHADKLAPYSWDLLVLDEAQYLKNPEAKRTKAVYGEKCDGTGLVQNAKQVFILSGTPAPNHPGELYPHVHAFPSLRYSIPAANDDYWTFCDTYSYVVQLPNGIQKITGARNLDVLRKHLSPHMLRRTKAEVLPEMPEMRLATYTLGTNHISKEVRDLEKSDSLKNINVMLSDVEASEAVSHTQVSGQLAEWRRLTEIAKVPLVVELLKQELAA